MFYRYEHSMSISPISHMAIFVYLTMQTNIFGARARHIRIMGIVWLGYHVSTETIREAAKNKEESISERLVQAIEGEREKTQGPQKIRNKEKRPKTRRTNSAPPRKKKEKSPTLKREKEKQRNSKRKKKKKKGLIPRK